MRRPTPYRGGHIQRGLAQDTHLHGSNTDLEGWMADEMEEVRAARGKLGLNILKFSVWMLNCGLSRTEY